MSDTPRKSPRARRLRRLLLDPIVGVLALLAYGLFRLLPIDAASALGGRIAGLVGPRLAADRVARRNLARAYPEKTQPEIDAIMAGLWNNLGRTIGEYPHLGEIKTQGPDRRVEVVDKDQVHQGLKGGAYIFLAAHQANWEISAKAATDHGVGFAGVYRAASNPIVDWLIRRSRKTIYTGMLPKGREGAKQVIGVLRAKQGLGMLVDQKFNEGLPIPFFGRDAMTATAPADLSMTFGCPLVPVQVERLGGARFRMTVHPPITVSKAGDRKANVRAALEQINALVERWVRERPEQWFWIHRRWPD